MPTCAAINCARKWKPDTRFHAFPVNKERRRIWATKIGRKFSNFPDGLPTTSMKLCQNHFTADQYRVIGNIRTLKKDAVPTVFLNHLLQNEEQMRPIDEQSNIPVRNNYYERNERPINDQRNCDATGIEVNEELVTNLYFYDQNCNNEIHKNLQTLLQAANDQINKLKNNNRKLYNQNHLLLQQLRNEKKKNTEVCQNLKSFLAEDQISRLENENMKHTEKWSESTIKSSLQIRMMTGCKGYEYLRQKANYPLPSLRTLRRRVEDFKFMPGLNSEIIPWLAKKVETLDGYARKCYICIDEMQMNSKIEYDKGLKRMVGFISPEIAYSENDLVKPACKVLAVVAKGMTKRWKQVIGTLLTGSSVDSTKQWECVLSYIHQLEKIGLDVRGISSDMGPNNVGMWSKLGVHATRGAKVSCSIPHPVDPQKRLYFLPDVPHLLKNLWAMIVSQSFYLPDDIKEKYKFSTNEISSKHVRELIKIQTREENRGMTLSYKLKNDHIDPSGFSKMRVHVAAEFFSRRTATALRLCAMDPNIPEITKEALPTAWFIELINDWFDIMNLRAEGIGKNERGQGKINKLNEVMEVMKKITFEKPGWKPVQTGVLLATTTVINLYNDLVLNGPIHYLLTSRLTTDSVENSFSQIRGCGGGNTNPGPVQIRNIIRLISISQYLHTPKNTNYEEDGIEYFVDFLRPPEINNNIKNDLNDDNDYEEIKNFINHQDFSRIQKLGLCYIAGWAAMKVSSKCRTCKYIIISENPIADNIPFEWIQEYSRGGLSYPSKDAFCAISLAEDVVCSLPREVIIKQLNCEDWLLQLVLQSMDEQIQQSMKPSCDHNTLKLLLRQYLKLRVHIIAEEINKESMNTTEAIKQVEEGSYASRSVFMKNSADNYGKKRRVG